MLTVHQKSHDRRRRFAVVAAAATLSLATGGSALAATATTKPKAKVATPSTKPATFLKSALPNVTVTDVITGKPFALASLADGKKPLLIWFWAPH